MVFFVLLIFQVILILNARKDYRSSFDLEKLKPLHFAIQSDISSALIKDCSSFDEAYIEKLASKAKSFGVEVHFSSEALNAVDDLLFKRLTLTTSLIADKSVTYSTHGYKVIYSKNNNCFGTI